MTPPGRLDGWKAIGGHFGRDRTTVMRWAQQRNLPVYRLPGGKIGTVYAFREELDQWAASQNGLKDEAPDPQPPIEPAHVTPEVRPTLPASLWTHHKRKVGLAAALGLVLITFTGTVLIQNQSAAQSAALASSGSVLPSDPALAVLYLDARDAWAQRTPESLAKANQLYVHITRTDPDYAPGWAGLADTFLLSREFGSMADNVAFPKAKAAAQKALSLDPHLADAHRTRGFILYWHENNPAEAGKAFREALIAAPNSAQTHFWYGNILSDNGQHVAAIKALNTARLIEPGSVAIQTDLAWAQWSAGHDLQARKAFADLLVTHPEFPVLYDCTSLIKLADGDYVGYVQDFSEFARLRDDPALTKRATQLRTALKSGAETIQAQLMAEALAEIRLKSRRTHVWAALLASVAQDRQQVMTLLDAALARKETWGESGLSSRITRLWMDDPSIRAKLRKLNVRAQV